MLFLHFYQIHHVADAREKHADRGYLPKHITYLFYHIVAFSATILR